MANLFSQSQVEKILGLQPGQATGGYAQTVMASDPAKKAAYDAAVAQQIAANRAGMTDQTGVMPATIEPLHAYERNALTALGSNNIGALRAAGVDPMAQEYLSRFGKYADDAAGLIKSGAGGFNQAEFDSYFNPYQQEVTNRSVAQLTEQAQNMKANLLKQQASNGGNAAFGSLYGAQQMGDITKQLLQTSGDIRASGNASGFNTALDALFKQRGNQLSGGQALAGVGGQAVNAANSAQNISNSGVDQAMTGLQGQLGSGAYIRDYNQNSANTAYANMVEPTRFGNALTQTAVAGTPGVVGQGYAPPAPYDRFGNVATGVGGALTDLSKIQF